MNNVTERSQIHATFVIERTYPVSVEAVWHALSDSDARDQWFGAGDAFDVQQKTHEFRVGGHSTEEGQWHGGPRSRFSSTYTDIVDRQRIVFTYDMWVEERHLSAGFFRVTRWVIDAEAWRQRLGFNGGERSTDSAIIAETFDAAGAYVMGRRMADGGEIPWGEVPPFRAPVFVVTHRPRPTVQRQGGTSFTYVTSGIEDAIDRARAAAGGKNVAIAGGGTLLRQVIKLGLLDELELHVIPVILGEGMRLLDPDLGLGGKEGIELTPARVVATPDVTHIRYKINGRRPLVLDNRGRDDQPATA